MRRVASELCACLAAIAGARGRLLPWAPVFLGLGIGLYFTCHREPGTPLVAAFAVIALCFLALTAFGREDMRPLAWAGLLIAGGFLLAIARAHMVAAPVLPFRYYGPVEGRIIDIDRSFSDQPRLMLDQVTLDDVRPEETPLRVRVALHGDQDGFDPQPGMIVRVTASLSPPDGPVEPGGFDFQRLAWFSSLGAVGYTRRPAETLRPAPDDWRLAAFRMRMWLSVAMQTRMQGQAGAFAAALMTGDRSNVTAQTNADLRASNLSHMISISGLHMGLLSGFVFALCRYGMALVPPLALRIHSKKVAAVVALIATTFYMILAGPDVAVRRSYIQVVVMLMAVLVDRRALSLRSVALAALICLLLEPESLVEPGFQMSFGATSALIVGFDHWQKVQHLVPALIRPAVVTVLSSLIAGTATAPIAAAHFNRIAEYGLIANLLAVPVCGMIVMPAGVMAAILAPFGLAQPALWALEKGAALILQIASVVAGLKGAVVTVPAPPDLFLPLFGLAGAVFLLGSGWVLRSASAAALALSLGLWTEAQRPVLLISGDGTLAGLITPKGRALSKEKGGGFIAQSWLENDGDAALQADAFARAAFQGPKGSVAASFGDRKVWVFAGKGSAARAAPACKEGALVILSEDWGSADGKGCLILDRRALRRTGALALYGQSGNYVFVSAREWAGKRLWNYRPRRKPPPTSDPVQAGAMKG